MLFHISVHDQHVHNDVAAFCGWHVLRFLMLFHISVHDQHVHNDVAAFCLWLTCTSQCGTFLYISHDSHILDDMASFDMYFTVWYLFIYLVILIYLMIWLLLTCTSQCGTFLYISRDSHILDDTASFDLPVASFDLPVAVRCCYCFICSQQILNATLCFCDQHIIFLAAWWHSVCLLLTNTWQCKSDTDTKYCVSQSDSYSCQCRRYWCMHHGHLFPILSDVCIGK